LNRLRISLGWDDPVRVMRLPPSVCDTVAEADASIGFV
jgi:hypothetical protein